MTALTVTDFSPHIGSTAFRNLLLLLVGWHEDEHSNQHIADQVIDAYRTNPSLAMLGIEADDQLIGLLGLEHDIAQRGVIRHIVVHPTRRGKGIGRLMVVQATARFGLRELSAETDAEAVGFYQRCGFTVQSLGEKYPGRERFHCMWRQVM